MNFYDLNINNTGVALSSLNPALGQVENSNCSTTLSEHLSDEGPVAPPKNHQDMASQVSLAALERIKKEEQDRKVQAAVARINAKCRAMEAAQPLAMQMETKEGQSLRIGYNEVSCATVISKLRFSQKTVNSKTCTGDTLDELQLSILKGWKKNFPLNVVKMPDGQFTSLDNRRLYVLKKLTQSNLTAMQGKVEIRVYDHRDKMDACTLGGILTPIKSNHSYETFQAFEDRLERHSDYRQSLNYATYGYGVVMRMLGSGSEDTLTYGFASSPTVESSSNGYQRTNVQQRWDAINSKPVRTDPFKD